MTTSWLAKRIEDCLELIYHEGFFRKLRMGNGVFVIQHHANTRGSFLQLPEFRNGRRKGLLVIPDGANDIGWKGFLLSIQSVIESKITIQNGESVDGKIVGRSSLVKGVSYTAVLRSMAGSSAEIRSAAEGKSKALVGDKGRQVTLGEVEGVLWDVNAQLKRVMEYVKDLMNKVDKGLDLVVGFGGGSSREEGGRGVDLSSLKVTSVLAKGISMPSQIGSLDASIFVHASVTMPPEGAVWPQAPDADEDGTSVQGSSLVENGGPSRVSSTLEETVKPLLEDANGVSEGSASPTCSTEGAVGSDKVTQQGLSGGGAKSSNVDGGEEPVMVTKTMDNNHIAVEQPYGGKETCGLSLVPCVGEGLEWGVQLGTVAGDNVVPLVFLPLLNDIADSPSDWVLNKVNELQQILGLSYGEHGEYEDQFEALFTAIEASHALETKSHFKKSREL